MIDEAHLKLKELRRKQFDTFPESLKPKFDEMCPGSSGGAEHCDCWQEGEKCCYCNAPACPGCTGENEGKDCIEAGEMCSYYGVED